MFKGTAFLGKGPQSKRARFTRAYTDIPASLDYFALKDNISHHFCTKGGWEWNEVEDILNSICIHTMTMPPKNVVQITYFSIEKTTTLKEYVILLYVEPTFSDYMGGLVYRK